jgi:hypothetical protein
MKRLTTFMIIAALLLQGGTSLAQIDNAKMNRDLRVASGVLASLMNNDSDHMFRGGEPEANYVEGFGVIFTIEDDAVFRYNYPMDFSLARKAQREAQKAYRESQRVYSDAQREFNDSNVVVAPSSRGKGTFKISGSEKKVAEFVEQQEKTSKEFTKKLREAFEIFLIDYSQLVDQLNPSDKILLTTKNNTSIDFVFVGDRYGNIEDKKSSRLSAEMLVKDHKDFEAGKLSREKLIEKIKFVENAEMERRPDLDLFGNMLKTNYSSKYTETYFISSLPKYELLEGLGAVYSVKVYSSYSEDGLYRMPGNSKSGLTEEERNKLAEAMYPQFVDDFKENMVRYGSTIKSLQEDDKLIVKIKMTKCGSCSFPTAVEFVVDRSVLEQFSKGLLTLDKAKVKVKMK